MEDIKHGSNAARYLLWGTLNNTNSNNINHTYPDFNNIRETNQNEATGSRAQPIESTIESEIVFPNDETIIEDHELRGPLNSNENVRSTDEENVRRVNESTENFNNYYQNLDKENKLILHYKRKTRQNEKNYFNNTQYLFSTLYSWLISIIKASIKFFTHKLQYNSRERCQPFIPGN